MTGIDAMRAALQIVPHLPTDAFVSLGPQVHSIDVLIPSNAIPAYVNAIADMHANAGQILDKCAHLVRMQLDERVSEIPDFAGFDALGCAAFSVGGQYVRVSAVPNHYFNALLSLETPSVSNADLARALRRLVRRAAKDALRAAKPAVVALPPIPTKIDDKVSADFLIPDSAIDDFLEGAVDDETIDLEVTERHLIRSLDDNGMLLRVAVKRFLAKDPPEEFRWAFAGIAGPDKSLRRFVSVPDLYFEQLAQVCGDGVAMPLSMRVALQELVIKQARSALM